MSKIIGGFLVFFIGMTVTAGPSATAVKSLGIKAWESMAKNKNGLWYFEKWQFVMNPRIAKAVRDGEHRREILEVLKGEKPGTFKVITRDENDPTKILEWDLDASTFNQPPGTLRGPGVYKHAYQYFTDSQGRFISLNAREEVLKDFVQINGLKKHSSTYGLQGVYKTEDGVLIRIEQRSEFLYVAEPVDKNGKTIEKWGAPPSEDGLKLLDDGREVSQATRERLKASGILSAPVTPVESKALNVPAGGMQLKKSAPTVAK